MLLLSDLCPALLPRQGAGLEDRRGRSPLRTLPTSPCTEPEGRRATAVPKGCHGLCPAAACRSGRSQGRHPKERR